MAVSIDQAILLALIASELTANALEHAFTGDAGGELRVTLSYVREPAATSDALDQAILEISDNGVPLPREWGIGAGETTGFQLVRTLTSQLRGQFRVQERTSGKRLRIQFPLDA